MPGDNCMGPPSKRRARGSSARTSVNQSVYQSVSLSVSVEPVPSWHLTAIDVGRRGLFVGLLIPCHTFRDWDNGQNLTQRNACLLLFRCEMSTDMDVCMCTRVGAYEFICVCVFLSLYEEVFGCVFLFQKGEKWQSKNLGCNANVTH